MPFDPAEGPPGGRQLVGDHTDLVRDFGASVPVMPLEVIARGLTPRSSPAGTTDASLAELRAERAR